MTSATDDLSADAGPSYAGARDPESTRRHPEAPSGVEGPGAEGFPALFRVRVLDETPSTNQEVKRALTAGEDEGLVVRARVQTGGYGRQGRSWISPEGGLYCSLLLRPHVEPGMLPTLSLVTGLAVRQALATVVEPSVADAVQIKWPNDVVLARDASGCHLSSNGGLPPCHPERREVPASCHPERREVPASCHPERAQRVEGSHAAHAESLPIGATRDPSTPAASLPALRMTTGDTSAFVATFAKLCGISLEAHGGGVCVGVGVNVLPPAKRPDVGGKNRVAYVADLACKDASATMSAESHTAFSVERAPVTVECVLDAFLASFAPLYVRWQSDGFAPFVDEFNARASLTGRDVRMVDRQGALLAAGTVVRVDERGNLVLRAPDGVQVAVASGEAHLA